MTEATEADPVTSDLVMGDDPETSERTDAAVAAFRRQLEGQVSVPASVVQDGLLDLWGILPEGDTRTVVERWLTETLGRNLYSVTDVDSRLDAVLSGQG
ncbi:MAG: hypothetical protein JO337_12195 [Acidimicrobiales bacterium]|nr:hypothetical protein [Acidimicrobiales bacterium]